MKFCLDFILLHFNPTTFSRILEVVKFNRVIQFLITMKMDIYVFNFCLKNT